MLPLIFVFGSNLAGRHGAGAARYAMEMCGAEWGQGEGLQGSSYAIPTMDGNIEPLPLDRIAAHVKTFVEFARAHPELTFNITRIGCGLAGFTPEQIGPLFEGTPDNCAFHDNWRAGVSR